MTPAPEQNQGDARLPENAFRPLQPGEQYEPVVSGRSNPPEVSLRSIAQGFMWSIVFSAAATYIALKLGQGIESAIPISILAVGFSVFAVKFMKRRACQTPYRHRSASSSFAHPDGEGSPRTRRRR